MRKTLRTTFLLLLAFPATSLLACAAVVVSPVGNGVLFTTVRGPINANPEAESGRSGEACASNILGLVAFGDASIEAAKRNGGIHRVATIDYEATTIFAIYSKFCTQIRGE